MEAVRGWVWIFSGIAQCQGFKNVGFLFIVIYLLHALLLIFPRHDLPYLNIPQI